MKREPIVPPPPAEPRVLRGVVLRSHPHALRTPGHHVPAWPGAAEADATPAGSQEPPSEAYLAGHRAGMAEGVAHGRHEGMRLAALEQTQAHDAAVAEARGNAAEAGRREGFDRGLAEGHAEAEARQRAAVEAAVAAATEALDDERSALAAQREALAREQDAMQAERSAMAQQHAEDMARIGALAAALPAGIQAQLVEVEDDMLALCHDVVCTVLGQHAAAPETLRAMLREARARLHAVASVTAHVHPDDHAALVHGMGPDEAGVTWVADASVSLGGLLVKSTRGSLDSRLEVQLAQLRATLMEVRERRRRGNVPGEGRGEGRGEGDLA